MPRPAATATSPASSAARPALDRRSTRPPWLYSLHNSCSVHYAASTVYRKEPDMELRTRLGQDRFFWMKDELTRSDRAALLVEAVAPAMTLPEGAAPTNLVVVLDRSGSMKG